MLFSPLLPVDISAGIAGACWRFRRKAHRASSWPSREFLNVVRELSRIVRGSDWTALLRSFSAVLGPARRTQ